MNGVMHDAATSTTGWWGSYRLDEGAAGYWRLGAFEMWVRRLAREWQVYKRHGEDPLVADQVIEVPTSRPEPGDGFELKRFAFERSEDTLRILPALADRGVVVSPEVAFSIPPREESTVYVSTPVWITLLPGTSEAVMDVPCHRPSDTWFGPNTRVGELAYASRTRATQAFESVTRVPHRAVSVVRIRNRAAGALQVERVMLPVVNLSLFVDTAGHLWTEAVTLEREEDGDFAGMRLGKGPPAEVGQAARVTGPRVEQEKGLSLRAFGSLLK